MWDYIESPYLIKWLVPWHSPIMWKYILAYHFKYRKSGETEVAPCLFDFPVQTHLFKQAPWDFSVILEEFKKCFLLESLRWVMVATPSQLPVRQGREWVRGWDVPCSWALWPWNAPVARYLPATSSSSAPQTNPAPELVPTPPHRPPHPSLVSLHPSSPPTKGFFQLFDNFIGLDFIEINDNTWSWVHKIGLGGVKYSYASPF